MACKVVIVAAARTPVGNFNGAFSSLAAHQLGAIAIKESLLRCGVSPEEVSEVFMGQVLTAGKSISHTFVCLSYCTLNCVNPRIAIGFYTRF